MASYTQQAVPAELLELYTLLTSPGKIDTAAEGTLRLRKRAKTTVSVRREVSRLRNLQVIAETLAADLAAMTGLPVGQDFVFLETQNLVLGILSDLYYAPMLVNSRRTLESTSTATPDPDPPPYGYRTQLFLPSLSEYAEGIETTQPLGFFGEKDSGYFADRWLRWSKIVWGGDVMDKTDWLDRIIMRWDATISIAATSRASRPMLSLMSRIRGDKQSGQNAADLEPPVDRTSPHYWRFKIPPSTPPYYNSSQIRRISDALRTLIKRDSVDFARTIVIDAANRPMLGRGYNNNDSVVLGLEGTPELWAIKTCLLRNLSQFTAGTNPLLINVSDAIYSPQRNLWVVTDSDQTNTSIRTSADGVSWTARSTPSGRRWSRLAYSANRGIFVAVANGGTNPSLSGGALSSTTGLSWTARTVVGSVSWADVARSDALDRFVAVSPTEINSGIMVSSTGTSWSLVAGAPTDGWSCIGYSNTLGRFVAMRNRVGQPGLMHSSDGLTWTVIDAIPALDWTRILWADGLGMFVAMHQGVDKPDLIISRDGLEWTGITLDNTEAIGDIEYCREHGMLVASIQTSGPDKIRLTHNGEDWQSRSYPGDADIIQLSWAGERCQMLALSNIGLPPVFNIIE